MTKRIIYGNSNFAAIRRKNGYIVDKSPYIAKLENVENPIFLRPRRFGKSYFCSMLRHYYDLNHAGQFDELFGNTWIGQNPTASQGKNIVLFLNFSQVDAGNTLEEIEHSFKNHVNSVLATLRAEYADLLSGMPEIVDADSASDNLGKVLDYIRGHRLPQVYVIIDEYDNFANHLITRNQTALYNQLTANEGFLKTFFKTLKAGRESGAIVNVFITGVLPITIDELAEEYISQFPEAVFQNVNKNFYRATFFELCSTHLSAWFTWNMERSYPKGRSDLEFVGKYHEKFAGMRWLLEFKYISNSKMRKEKTRIDKFKLVQDDKDQLLGYAKGLAKEYPEAKIELFVIYCFGNQGYRVFDLAKT